MNKPPKRQPPAKNLVELAQMGLIDEIFVSHLQRAEHLMRRATSKAWEGYDLRSGAIGGMAYILANPGCSQNDIVNRTTFDKSAVNAIINNLEELGWAERRKADDDRRRHELYPTELGATELNRIVGQIQVIETRIFGRLPAETRGQLMELLDKLHDSCRTKEQF